MHAWPAIVDLEQDHTLHISVMSLIGGDRVVGFNSRLYEVQGGRVDIENKAIARKTRLT